jgi:thioesterase domain-containing protein
MLGVEGLGVEDDFFEMGGDSLLGWRLVAAAGQSLGVDLPLMVLYEKGSTVRGMAASIRASDPTLPDGPPGVAAEPKVACQTLFYIVPNEATLIALRHIVSSLCEDCRVVGLPSGLLGKRFDRSTTVESLASEALVEIRARQPHGPYFIAGVSIGGLVAYEVARILRSEGEVIGWLGLVDTLEPSRVKGPSGVLTTIVRRRHRLRGVMFVLRSWINRHFIWLRPFPPDQFDSIGALQIVRRHIVVGHDAPLDAFISEQTAAAYGPSGGWDLVHKGVLVTHSVPGDHDTILAAAQATTIAEVLSEKLQHISLHNADATT